MKSILARHYKTDKILKISWDSQGLYKKIEPSTGAGKVPYIAPGLFDPQINGFAGVDFNSLGVSPLSWLRANKKLYASGCTHFLLALITHSENNYRQLFKQWSKLLQSSASAFRGYHLEGPFLNPSKETRGVHPSLSMKPPSLAEFKKYETLSQHHPIKLLTIAPEKELNAALRLIRYLVKKEIRVSLGHSSASTLQIDRAIKAGASAWTHLGNASPHQVHKFDNLLFRVLSQKRLIVSLIPDGFHLPPFVLKFLAQNLSKRMVLTTDAISAAASSKKNVCTLGQLKIQKEKNGRAVLQKSDGKLAGSTLTPIQGVFRAARLAEIPWQDAWEAFSVRTARWLGFSHDIKQNYEASFCLLEKAKTKAQPTLIATFLRGRQCFGKKL